MVKLIFCCFVFLTFCSSFSFAQESPKVLEAVAPQFVKPENKEANFFCGKVVVETEINNQGEVIKTNAISGHPKLRPISEKAAEKWLFDSVETTAKPRFISLTFNFQCEYKKGNSEILTIYKFPYQIDILFPPNMTVTLKGS